MANTGIKNSWNLVSFAKRYNKVFLAPFKDKDGNDFQSIVFEGVDGDKTFVGFSSNLGELSIAEIGRMKDKLQVVQLESGTYKLCKQGEGSTWVEFTI